MGREETLHTDVALHSALDLRWSGANSLDIFSGFLDRALEVSKLEDLPIVLETHQVFQFVKCLCNDTVFVWLTSGGLDSASSLEGTPLDPASS